MTRDELEHAIRAACDVAGDTELFVFGSQAILGQYPQSPETLRKSVEVDIALKNRPEMTDAVDSNLGELSLFHKTHGFYVHGLSLDAASLPAGWDKRLIKVQNDNTRQCIGWCVEAHDLAAGKLVAFREKDRAFVRVLLAEGFVEPSLLLRRVRSLGIPPADAKRLEAWVGATAQEISGPP